MLFALPWFKMPFLFLFCKAIFKNRCLFRVEACCSLFPKSSDRIKVAKKRPPRLQKLSKYPGSRWPCINQTTWHPVSQTLACFPGKHHLCFHYQLHILQLLFQTRHQIVKLVDDRLEGGRLCKINPGLLELLHGIVVATGLQKR